MLNWQIELDKLFSYSSPKINPFRSTDDAGIVLYGAGAMGEMALDLLETISIRPEYFVDKNLQGDIRGIAIISPENISPDDLKAKIFIICIVTVPIDPIVDYLHSLGCRDVRHFYDYSEIALKDKISNGWALFSPSNQDKQAIANVLKKLEHDSYSIAHYLQFLWWRLRRKEHIYQGYSVLSAKKYFKAPCIPKLQENEIFLDAGAHFGTTIEKFIETTHGYFGSIWAYEPDQYNFERLKKALINNRYSHKIYVYTYALSNKSTMKKFINKLGFASHIDENGECEVPSYTIDSLHLTPTIIKLHLEGHELKALEGAKDTISKSRPIIMALADHNEDGLYKIANFLTHLDSYTLYFYLHDYCGNSAIFYAIPNERHEV